MSTKFDVEAAINELGVDELMEQMAMACREKGEDTAEETLDEESARKWRVRGNGVMQALRFYQAFIKERSAETI